jgi:hypothetical protein
MGILNSKFQIFPLVMLSLSKKHVIGFAELALAGLRLRAGLAKQSQA